MEASPEKIAAAIAALEAQLAALGDSIVDTALAPLRRELVALEARERQRAVHRDRAAAPRPRAAIHG